jgi:methionyl aminopeptidase
MILRNVFTKPEDIKNIHESTEISSIILAELRNNVKEGTSAKDIDDLAYSLCAKYKVKPSFKGVRGAKSDYPSAVCVSINDEVIHSIPYESKIFKKGDIIKIDFGVIYNGFYTDHCVTVGLEPLSKREKQLISTAKLCIDTAIKQAVVGNTIGDISYALQSIAELGNFGYVTSYCGHGIGKGLHESPEVPSWGYPGKGIPLVEGMLLCVENQVAMGSGDVKTDADGWTIRTVDGSKCAMFEHMVLVKRGNPEILTLLD